MTRSTAFGFLTLAGLAAAVACSDVVAPTRSQRYDWRLIVTYDSVGLPFVDTLSFHWPRGRVPVRIWVENQFEVPDRIREGIATWRNAFLYNEWNGAIVSDSNAADVIVRTILPPPLVSYRFAALANSCEGATDVDTGATRFQLRLPIRLYVFPNIPNAPDIRECLRTVATHELGHSMGLFQHSADSLDIMFGVPTADFLTDRDVGTALNAYHFKTEMVPVGP